VLQKYESKFSKKKVEKVYTCKDAGYDCPFEARGKTEVEVLLMASEHGRKVHKIKAEWIY
jgi:predicted small metal-binding protein